MPNIMDYLQWRGDLTLSQSPFCEVDNLILSYLSYVNLDGIAPAPQMGAMTVKEASNLFFDLYSPECLKADRSFIRLAPYVMEAMAGAQRFQNAKIQNYVNELAFDEQFQFAALEIVLDDGTSYVAYRGTDDTIVGWKEDFQLSTGVVPAQRKAADYLNRVAGNSMRKLRVGGHSKGGNLAVYAAAMCEPEVQERIEAVYCNDGPGFLDTFLTDSGFQRILPKIQRFVPEASVIGMVLGHGDEPTVISSSQKGILQHDGLSWEVLGARFLRKEKIDRRTEIFNDTLHNWLENLEPDTRAEVVGDFFSVLEATGAQTLTGLQEGGLRYVSVMMKKAESLRPETKIAVDDLLKSLFGRLKELVLDNEKEGK